LGVGEPGNNDRASVLAIKKGEAVHIDLKAAAMLEEQPRDDIRRQPLTERPYWHVERARIGDTRQVVIELIVNGEPVQQKAITADGRLNDVSFELKPTKSCWIAARVFPAAHTNPIFVEVDGQPIQPDRRSVQWCIDSVDRCWESKLPLIRPSEVPEAKSAFDQAREAYRAMDPALASK
jgi:hypothetical protein